MNLERYIIEIIASFISSVGFSYLFGCPKKSTIASGIIGSIGWTIYKISYNNFLGLYLSTALGAFITASLGELSARKYHMPASMFIIPGIANFAPGAGIYNTLTYFVKNQNDMAISKLLETLVIAGAIAFGILMASLSSKSLSTYRIRTSDRIKYVKTTKRREE